MSRKKILFIDADDGFVRDLAASAEAAGFGTLVTASSVDGVDLAKSERPDLIVVSVELSPTNGWSVCTKLKKDDELKDIPVVLTSSTSTQDTFEKHKKLKTRAEEYLLKPFGGDELVRVAGELVGLPDPPAGDEELVVEDEPLALGDDLAYGADEAIAVADDEPLSTPSELDAGATDALDALQELGGLDVPPADYDEGLALDRDPSAEESVLADDGLGEALGDDGLGGEAYDPLGEAEAESGLGTDDAPSEVSEGDELAAFDRNFDDLTPGDDAVAVADDDDEPTIAELGPGEVEDEPLAYEDAPLDGTELPYEEQVIETGAEESVDVPADEPPLGELGGETPVYDEPPATYDASVAVGEGSGEDPAHVAQLDARIAELEAELEGYRAADSSRDGEFVKLRADASRKDRELLDLRAQVNERDKRILEAQEAEQSKDADLAKAKAEIARNAATLKALTAKGETAAAQARKLEKDLATAREDAKAAASLKQRVAELEREYSAAKDTEGETAVELDGLREQVAAITALLEESRRTREALESEDGRVRTELEESRAAADRSATALTDAEARAADAEARAADAEARAADAEARTADAEARAADAEARAVDAEARAVDAEARAVDAEARAVDADGRVAEADARASQADDQVRAAREGLERLLQQLGPSA